MSNELNIDLEVYVEGIEIAHDGKDVYLKIRAAWDEHSKVFPLIEAYATNKINRLRLTSKLIQGGEH